jgi:hypothetical protein
MEARFVPPIAKPRMAMVLSSAGFNVTVAIIPSSLAPASRLRETRRQNQAQKTG